MVSDPASTEMMRRALAIACAALDEPETQRRRWAEEQCGNDTTLRAEVVSLLAADETPERALERSLDEPEIHDPWPGRLVGRYRVGERIGSGGMGTVYRAEPESGLPRQPVALKLIKRGMDTDEILRRFLREREILARLVHPNIARLLDGGMTVDGRPWFALELVDGAPLLDYCDEGRLSLPARVDLMLQICDAVAYAHQNLVVHRDLKPSNVLITREGQVKLLDFGIAKLIDADGEAATRSMQAMMTPDYAAPEQYERGLITTQTDVYLLGLLLAELLTGKRPAWPLRSAAEVDFEFTRLDLAFSVRGASQDSSLAEVATRRSTSVGALARSLRGDLDRITRRATAYQPERRYPSVAELADDLRRHRRGEPVVAMGDSIRYRLGKFVRRHRSSVSATLAVVIALAIGAAATLRESGRLRIAQAHTQTSLELLEDVFLGADPYTARGGDTRATDLLAGVRNRIETETQLPPALAARLWFKLGIAYVSLDERAAAEHALQASVASARQALSCRGSECIDVDATAVRIDLAAAQARLAHYQLVIDGDLKALPTLESAIAQLRGLGATARHPLAQALQFFADHEFNQGRYDNLDRLSAESVALERADGGDLSTRTIIALGIRSSLLRAITRYTDALAAASEARDLATALGEAAPAGVLLYTEQQFAGALTQLDRPAEAEPVLRAARDRANALRGPRSGISIGLSWELADAQSELGHYEQAIQELRQLLEFGETFKGANGAALHNALGFALLGSGQADAAAAEFQMALQTLCPNQADTPPCLAIGLNCADADLSRGLDADARRQLDVLQPTAVKTGGRPGMRWHLLQSRWLLQQGDTDASARALDDSRAALAAIHPTKAIDQANLLRQEALIAQSRDDAATALTLNIRAEQLYSARWTGEPAALKGVRADIASLQRASD